jgi:anti-sigma regulatory factor (Ser/Thr protein kinase)
VRGVGQLAALTSLAADAGVRVGLTVHGVARRLPPAVDLAAYRIVQEALTNVLRHAGPATAMVRLTYDEDHLAVQVDDDGHGRRRGGRRLAAMACSGCVNGWPPSGAGWKPGRGPQAASACWATLPLDGTA